jgi:hydroxyquinol 1,2-dioxygenase
MSATTPARPPATPVPPSATPAGHLADVLASFDHAPSPRLAEVLQAAVRHLHAFVEETHLTRDEWLAGIQFLTAVGHMCDDVRQEFILLSDTLGVSMLTVMLAQARGGAAKDATEATVQGPFYREGAPELPLGADIAQGVAGEPALYRGRVLDEKGKPVAGAIIDVWSSDARGFYDVQVGEAMMARGRFVSDERGRYWFWSIRPTHYPVPTDGPVGRMLRAMGRHAFRPAHMHFMVNAKGYAPLVTHVFDRKSKYLDSDAVFGVRASLIGDFTKHKPGEAPDGQHVATPYYTLDFDLRLTRKSKRRVVRRKA